MERGRPAKTDPITRERICQIARCCPRDLGLTLGSATFAVVR
jgi:hypothetical protein